MLGQTKSMPGLGNIARVGILIGVAVLAAGVALWISPIAQDPAYHQFADRRAFLGIPNFGDSASSIGFLIVGALGTAFVIGGPGRWLFDAPGERWPFLFFFAAVALVGAGSAYYHADPTTETLLWDRLPMTVAFMALLSAFITDRIHARLGVAVILPLLLAIGIGAVVYWYFSEAAGRGDLAPYALVQLFPLLAIPLICLLFPGRRTSGKHVVYLVLWYALAKLCERLDGEIYALLGNTVSGHSLKHLMAAAAAAVMLAMLRRALPDLRREEPWTKNS
jgi:hypothetical protein